MPKDESLETGEEELEEEQELDEQGSDGEGDDEEFDKERAMKTIRNQREAEKDLKKDLSAAKKRLAELEKAEKERAKAELSEKERLEQELTEAQEAAEKAEADLEARATEFNERLIQAEVRAVAATMQFASPEDAYHLADLSGVEVAEDGSVKGVEKALKALVKDKPYLLSENGDKTPGTPRTGGRKRAPAGERDTSRRVDDDRPIVRF